MIVVKAFITRNVNGNSCTTWQWMSVLNHTVQCDFRQTYDVVITAEH